MTEWQKHACINNWEKWKINNITQGLKKRWKTDLTVQNSSFWGLNILGCHSWAFGNIMPGVVRHNNPTKEYSENCTQIEKLQDNSAHIVVRLSFMLNIKWKGSPNRCTTSSEKPYFGQHIWEVSHEYHKSNLTISRVPVLQEEEKCEDIVLKEPEPPPPPAFIY